MKSTKTHRSDGTSGRAGLIAAALMATPLAASAQEAPLSHVANPGIYKVLGENELFRAVLGTWKPGQRDVLHSHPASATYALTACDMRIYGPNGVLAVEAQRPQGSAVMQGPVAAHAFENAGKSDCQILIVERK
jgi:hypothetical protein